MIAQQPCPTLSPSRLASAVNSPFAAGLLARAQSIAKERCQSLQSASRSLADQVRSFSAATSLRPLIESEAPTPSASCWHRLSAAFVRQNSGSAAHSSHHEAGLLGPLPVRHTEVVAAAARTSSPVTCAHTAPRASSKQQQATAAAPPAPSAPSLPLFAAVQWLFVQQLDTLMKGRADSTDYMTADMQVL